jgi:hypothetical protein
MLHIVSQINPTHTTPSSLFKINLNIVTFAHSKNYGITTGGCYLAAALKQQINVLYSVRAHGCGRKHGMRNANCTATEKLGPCLDVIS